MAKMRDQQQQQGLNKDERYDMMVQALRHSSEMHREIAEELGKLGLLIELGQPLKAIIWGCQAEATKIDQFLEDEPKETKDEAQD